MVIKPQRREAAALFDEEVLCGERSTVSLGCFFFFFFFLSNGCELLCAQEEQRERARTAAEVERTKRRRSLYFRKHTDTKLPD